jgi:hypothetical protein
MKTRRFKRVKTKKHKNMFKIQTGGGGRIEYPNGNVYIGEIQEDNKPNGNGTMYYSDGTQITCDWKDGQQVVIVKKYSSDDGDNSIQNIISTVFTPDVFDITQESKKRYNITSKQTGKLCIHFTVYAHHIYVGELSKKCISGSKTLEKIENVAKLLNINEIHLQDGSHLDFERCHVNEDDRTFIINLKLLNILSSGQSFYNKRGYKNDMYDTNYRNNTKIINMQINDFFDKCLLHKLEPRQTYISAINEVINIYNGATLPPPNGAVTIIDSAISVRDFFNKIKSDLQNEDFDCNLILIIRTVLDLILRTKIIHLDSGNIKKILHEPEQVDSTCRKCNIMGGHKSKKTRKKFERFD